MAPRDRDDNNDRPRRSWSEIDKMRDGKRSGGGQVDRDRERFERTSGYSRYKSAADAFFSGEATPEVLREKMDATGDLKVRQDLVARMKKAADNEQAFAEAAAEHLQKFGAPEDPYLLDRMLGHKDAAVVKAALEKLEALAAEGSLAPPKSLAQRLRTLELAHDDPDVQDAAKRLGRKVKDLKPPAAAPPKPKLSFE
jgi:hypothetical protein